VTAPSVNVDDVAAREAAAAAENVRYGQLKGELMRWAVAAGACGSGAVFLVGSQARSCQGPQRARVPVPGRIARGPAAHVPARWSLMARLSDMYIDGSTWGIIAPCW
jgi:hypothetical protein